MSGPVELLLAALIGYGLGSIPFGVLLVRAAGLGDVRAIGSGNIGATNVLRTGRKDIAAGTLLADAGKAAAAVLIARFAFGESAAAVAGAAAFFGHCFSVWLKFEGGKGVASFLGATLALIWPLGVALCGVWLLAAAVFRYSSLAALIAMASAPALALAAGRPDASAALLLMTAVAYYRHKANIGRLLRGEEPKIGASRKK